jgi:hypothetical protein
LTAEVTTVRIGPGSIGADQQCFIDFPGATWQSTGTAFLELSGSGAETVRTEANPITLTDGTSSPLFPRETALRYQAYGDFTLRFELYGTLGDIVISSQSLREGEIRVGASEASWNFHSPSRPACNIEVELEITVAVPMSGEAPVSN